MDILYFSKNPPLAFLKPGAILIPLEVYLVNSPSRPNSRPACPLFPAERGSVSRRNLARPAGMIIETRTPSVRRISLRFTAPHPVSSIALHRQGGTVFSLPHPGNSLRLGCGEDGPVFTVIDVGWLASARTFNLIKAESWLNQGKKPSNQGSSSLIKANAKIP